MLFCKTKSGVLSTPDQTAKKTMPPSRSMAFFDSLKHKRQILPALVLFFFLLPAQLVFLLLLKFTALLIVCPAL